MTGNCPRCHTPIEISAPGAHQCPHCARRFHAYPIRPGGPPIIRRTAAVDAAFTGFTTPAADPVASGPPDERFAPERATPVGQARCATHANNHAVASCERCGDFMCGLCEIPLQARLYCPRCYEALFQQGSVAVASGKTGNSPTIALVLGVLSVVMIICTPINFGLAVAAALLGMGFLKQHRAQPELPGRGMAVAALVLAGISVVGGAGYLLLGLFGLKG